MKQNVVKYALQDFNQVLCLYLLQGLSQQEHREQRKRRITSIATSFSRENIQLKHMQAG